MSDGTLKWTRIGLVMGNAGLTLPHEFHVQPSPNKKLNAELKSSENQFEALIIGADKELM